MIVALVPSDSRRTTLPGFASEGADCSAKLTRHGAPCGGWGASRRV